MKRRHQLDAVIVVPSSAKLGDRGLHAEKGLHRELPQRDDDLGADQLELPEEEGLAARDLVGLRVPVVGRPTLDDVGDVDVLPPDLHPLGDDLGQQLAGPADERLPLQVLVPARRLTDEDETGTRIAHAEDNLLAPLLVENTTRAIADVFADLAQRGDGIG